MRMRRIALGAAVALLGSTGASLAASQTVITTHALSISGLPPVVADASGLTLYMSNADKNGRSSCYGKCTTVWKPVLAQGSLVARKGANPKLLGTTTRKGGSRQVTYNRHPIYLYQPSFKERPGDYDGEGCGNRYALSKQGKALQDLPPSGNCQGY